MALQVSIQRSDGMKKWFAYMMIENDLEKGYKNGNVIIFHRPSLYSREGRWRTMELMNVKTGIRKIAIIGLGYANFKDEADYNKRLGEVVEKKLEKLLLLLVWLSK